MDSTIGITLLVAILLLSLPPLEGTKGKQGDVKTHAVYPWLHKRSPVTSVIKTLWIQGHPYKAIVVHKGNKYHVKVLLSGRPGGKYAWLHKKPGQPVALNKGNHGAKIFLSRPAQTRKPLPVRYIWPYKKPIKHKGKLRHKLLVLRAPILRDKFGVAHKTTAKETGETYLTGRPLRILNKDNTFDTRNPFLYFPIIPDKHQQGRRK